MGLLDAFKRIFGGNDNPSANNINTVNFGQNTGTGIPSSGNPNENTPTASGPLDNPPQNNPSAPQITTQPNTTTPNQLSNSVPSINNNQPTPGTGTPGNAQEPSLPQEDAGNSLDSQGQADSTTTIITGGPATPNPEQNGTSGNPDDQTPKTP